MDFSTFVIAGPTTLTTTVAKELGGSMGTAAGSPVNLATECLTDTFSMTGPAGSVPPVICGTNSGEHSKTSNALSLSILSSWRLKPSNQTYCPVTLLH